MLVFFEIDFSNFISKSERLEKSLKDFTEPHEEMRSEIRDVLELQFSAEGTPRWAALTVPYAQEKLARWGVKPILEASGAMKKGYLNGGTIDKDELVFAYPTIYARRHQTGYKITQRALDLEFVEPLGLKICSAYVEKEVREAGF